METTQVLGILIITIALVATLLTTYFVRAGKLTPALRRIPAYDRMPELVGLSIESSRPLHISLGSAGIGDESTLLAITSAELAYQLTARAAIGDAPPILTLTSTSAIPLGQDTLRRAYQRQNLASRYRPNNVRWYPSGARSLAFAAAITALIGDDRPAANVLAGSYGTELALIMEAAGRRDQPTIAVSDQLEGQAIAYALSSEVLIGEEIFAAGTYLDGGGVQVGETVTIDVLRWLLVAVIIIGFILVVLNGG